MGGGRGSEKCMKFFDKDIGKVENVGNFGFFYWKMEYFCDFDGKQFVLKLFIITKSFIFSPSIHVNSRVPQKHVGHSWMSASVAIIYPFFPPFPSWFPRIIIFKLYFQRRLTCVPWNFIRKCRYFVAHKNNLYVPEILSTQLCIFIVFYSFFIAFFHSFFYILSLYF